MGDITEQREIADYRQLIEELARKSMNQRVSNGQPQHAAILLETMLKRARESVRIFTGELSPEAYDAPGLVEAALQFVGKHGSRLRILLQERHTREWTMGRPLVKSVDVNKANLCGTLEVRCATGAYAGPAAHHFAVMDEQGYRFEHDHSKMRATANFNEPKVARSLITAFDLAFGIAVPLLVVPA